MPKKLWSLAKEVVLIGLSLYEAYANAYGKEGFDDVLCLFIKKQLKPP